MGAKLLLIVLCCVLVAYGVSIGLFYLVDDVWNGAFLDWLEANFVHVYEQCYPEYGLSMMQREILWGPLKQTLRNLLVLGLAVLFLLLAVCMRIASRRAERRTVEAASQLIQQYRQADENHQYSAAYAGIAAQMAEIMATMQRNEQMLRDEARRKNDLITYLAHDLKTPLTSIIGYLSLLDEAPELPLAQRAKYVHISLEKALRLEQLINEFFDITRYNLQQIVLEREPIDLSYMLVQMTDEFYPALQAHGNQVSLQAAEQILVSVDGMKMARVFNNLLKNAIAYSYPNTEITVTAQQQEDVVVVTFVNQGKTIPPQKLEAIFEKFFRLDDARATNTGGAGLGLAIAKEIVTLHGGNITAASVNEQTTFTVTLPV